jgi:ubiquinone/menaquinone biosynthesis C-methylase UbiE
MRVVKPRFTPLHLSKDDIRRAYAKLSHIYDLWGFLTESKAVERALQLAHIKNGDAILEVAVGTGSVFKRIVASNEKGRNEGIDLSPDMLSKAKQRLKGQFTNYSLQVADAYSLPYPACTFDLLINNYMFDLLPEEDFPRVLSEFHRVMKPGGRVVITSMTLGGSWYSRIWDWLIYKSPDLLAGCRPISLEADIKKAGFQNIQAEYVSQFTLPSLVIYAEKP